MRRGMALFTIFFSMGCAARATTGTPTAPPSATASATASAAAAPARRAAEEDLLDGKAAERHNLRAFLVANDPIVFAEGGEPIAMHAKQELSNPIEAIVVEQRGEQLRVVLEGREIRLVVFAPPSCIALVVKKAASLTTTATEIVDEAEGIRLAPGVRLTEVEARGDRRHVTGEAEGVPFDGWIDTAATDRAFVDAPFVREGVNALALEGAVISSATGATIARIPGPYARDAKPEMDVPVSLGPGERPGYKQITYRNKAVEIRGWVRAADTRPISPDDGFSSHGSGFGDGGGMSDTPTARLLPGTDLLDEEGARVGEVKEESTLYLHGGFRAPPPEPGALVPGWVHASGLGFVTVRVRQQDLRPD